MSSGNLIADRRFATAQALRAEGDFVGAADVLTQALELAPAWREGLFTLAETLAQAGQTDAAVNAYRTYLTVDPTDSLGAGVKLFLLDSTAPGVLSPAYVTRLFDEYAPRFDAALVERLKYRGPTLLREAVERVAPGRFARVLDLGCGTGLSGAAFRDAADWLGGIDLSPAMIRKAAAKNIYDHLGVGDIATSLRTLTEPCDLAVAADVLVYIGDLAEVFVSARGNARVFAFTAQRLEDGDYQLGREHRYSHSRAYLTRMAEAAGFIVALMDNAVVRQEAGTDVPGLVCVLV